MERSISTESRSESRQFGINVATNGVVIVLNVLVGLLFTPYLIDRLGIASYGLVVLAVSLTGYMSMFETAINSAVGRFLTIDIRKGKFDAANRTFNTAFWSGTVLIIALLPITLVFSYFVTTLFDVPNGKEQSARLLFAAVMVAYLLVIIRGTFTASAFSYNRLDLKNAVFASNTIVRVGIVILLFSLTVSPAAWQVGLGTLSGAILSLILAVWIWHLLTPGLHIDWHLVERSTTKSMFGMSGWLLVNQLGSLLFLNIDLIIVNYFLGIESQGRYGAILQLVILLRTLAMAVSSAITPIALKQYARKDTERMVLMTRKSIKWMGLFFALPIGCIVGLARPFLVLWLGDDFSSLALLTTILVFHLCINLAVLPLFSIQTTLNKVRWPGTVTAILGLLNVVLAISWVKWESTGVGVALASAVVLTLKNAIFTPIYGAHIQKLPKFTFYRDMLPGIIGTLLMSALCFGVANIIKIDSWGILLLCIAALSLLYATWLYTIVLDRQERRSVVQAVARLRLVKAQNG